MPTETLILRFKRERETKNTVRFEELTDSEQEPIIGTLYVRNAGLARLGDPDELTVSVSTAATAAV